MAELRWNPMIRDWVMIASHRQNRPQMPVGWCPFCPGSSEKIPKEYDVFAYDNDFPALSQNPPIPDDVAGEQSLYSTRPAYGKCEVILFSPEHEVSFCNLSLPHVEKVVNLWVERFNALSADEKIKYIFIFENRGDVVGVTMPHPHGQIYGYSVVPKKIELELESAKEHKEQTGNCLFCDMNRSESDFAQRIVYENESFICYIPFFCEYPYGIYITAKAHVQTIAELNGKQKSDLALAMKNITGAYDSLFDYKFPYMMCMHNAPVNSGDTSHYHFHIEFFPPMRSADKQKFNASSETGVWAHCNPTAPEEKAEEMRQALGRFLNKH